MKIAKSSRHSKITGDFSESLILYWLSKYGFECALVDHTGIDIIANNPHTNEIMGISVKSRSRNEGSERTSVMIPNEQYEKVEKACLAFGCSPYFAIVVDAGSKLKAFILRMEHLKNMFSATKTTSWKMNEKWTTVYENDPEIKSFEFKHKTNQWW